MALVRGKCGHRVASGFRSQGRQVTEPPLGTGDVFVRPAAESAVHVTSQEFEHGMTEHDSP
ncbi:hypothetical protein AMK10_18490 [Streptomyces sp. CB02058]|nr:hypothetical protein AMK10_18490 [Streptomyces sp. CB02058]